MFMEIRQKGIFPDFSLTLPSFEVTLEKLQCIAFEEKTPAMLLNKNRNILCLQENEE